MSHKIRIKVKTQGYYFPKHSGLVWHSGKFWHNEKEAKIVYNNGSKAVLISGTKYGIIKLRKQAIKCTIEILDDLPF